MSAGKVLIILPSSRFLKLNNAQTCMVGYHLKELAVPVKHLRQNDYQVIIATAGGETPFIDPYSLSDVNVDERLFYEILIKENTQLLLPLSLERMSEEFLGTVDGVFIPGGYGSLIDFWSDPAIKHILKHMHKHSKPTAAIGHGVIAFAYELQPEESWAYKDYQLTCTPESEDLQNEQTLLKGELTHHVSKRLELAGAKVQFDPDNDQGFVLEDREVITGQAPSSSKALALLFLDKLAYFQRHRSC